MKFIGTYKRKVTDEDGNLEITFALSGYDYKQQCNELEKDTKYKLEIGKFKEKRSLNQNAYFWKLVDEIDIKINGHRKDKDNLYIQLLEMALYIMARKFQKCWQRHLIYTDQKIKKHDIFKLS